MESRSGRIGARALGLLLTLSLAGAACAGPGSAGSGGATASSGIRGTVMVSPACPVEQAGNPCPPRPMRGATVIVTDAQGNRVMSVSTDARGRFRATVAPGRYVLTVEASGQPIARARPVEVRVPASGFVHASIAVDVGIR